MPLWGYLGDKFGNKPLMAISVVGTFTLPLFWVFASPAHHDFAAFSDWHANNASAGFFWAGFNLLQFNLLIRLSPPQKTQVYVAVMAAVTGADERDLAPIAGGETIESACELARLPLSVFRSTIIRRYFYLRRGYGCPG